MAEKTPSPEEKNLSRRTNNADGEPVNSSRDEAQPEADELLVDSQTLSHVPQGPFENELFPEDGRDSKPGARRSKVDASKRVQKEDADSSRPRPSDNPYE